MLMISHWKENKILQNFRSLVLADQRKTQLEFMPQDLVKLEKENYSNLGKNQRKSHLPNICEMYLRPLKRPFTLVAILLAQVL